MTSFSDAEIRRFQELQCWIFDLDDTLYPKDCGLFSHVDARMSLFIQQFLGESPEEAPRVQKRYFHAYGTTLKRLMHHHDVRPELFLEYVHDIDYGVVPRDDQLTAALQRLPGCKVIFTNGTTAHAAAVLKRLGADVRHRQRWVCAEPRPGPVSDADAAVGDRPARRPDGGGSGQEPDSFGSHGHDHRLGMPQRRGDNRRRGLDAAAHPPYRRPGADGLAKRDDGGGIRGHAGPSALHDLITSPSAAGVRSRRRWR